MSPTLPIEQPDATGAEQPETGLEFLRDEFDRVVKERVDGEVDFEKTFQYMRLRKTDLYYRGLQFTAPTINGGYLDVQPVGVPMIQDQTGESRGLFDYNMDIVRTYGRRYFSVLGLRPFHNVKALPDDPQSEVDRRAAQQAELAASWLKGVWNARIKNIEIFYWQWKAGTVYVYTPFVSDKGMFGEVSEPKFVNRPTVMDPGGYVCPQCGEKSEQPEATNVLDDSGAPVEATVCPTCKGPLSDMHRQEPTTVDVPEQDGIETYPGSGPACYLTTGYTTTTAFDCKDINQAPYLNYEYEEDQGILLQTYGEKLRKHLDSNNQFGAGDATMAQSQAIITRQQAFSLTATPRSSAMGQRWTYRRLWLRPSMFEYFRDEKKREVVKQQFPDGVKLHFVMGKLVDAEPENLADVWTAIVPEPGDSIYNDPQAWGILGQQDMKNDLSNIAMAYAERGLPTHVVDVDVIDPDAINNRSYMPNEIIGAKPLTGKSLDSAVKSLQHNAYPKDMLGLADMTEGSVQNYTGLLPPVFGGGERQPTAEGQRTVLNQALMQLAVPGEYAAQGWCEMLTKAIRVLAKHSPKAFKVSMPGKGALPTTSEMLDFDALANGKWHLESEPGVPMSWAEKRDQLNAIITQNPELAQAMGLNSALNIPVVRDYLLTGMYELRVPGEETREKALDIIRQLLDQQPQQGPDGQLIPSIAPENFVDDPAQCAEIAREWLNSPQGRKAKAENPQGYSNVLAWGLAQSALIPPPPEMGGASPPPPAAAPGPGGPPPPPGPPDLNTGGQPMPPPETQLPPDNVMAA